ncbi:MAG TPA: GNAT family N-acetyltransferase [Thermoanaerobaculia bacterium]|nr:GNAT family N-acetyltransferase [Thermoanaerobaculia bacterium]
MLRRANDAPYDLSVVAEEKCFGAGLNGAPRVRVWQEDARLAGIAVTCGRYLRILAVDRDFRGRGIGTALLEDAGARVIGAEPGNYFLPGVLEPAFFLKRGYREAQRVWNLECAVSGGQAPRLSGQAGPPVLHFIETYFSKAWRFEAEHARILHYIDNVGFAVAEANNRGLGTFGPTGVAVEHRGRGYGHELLHRALASLAALGYTRAIIPWTDALEYYRKGCGAEPAHEFAILERR